MSGRYREAGVNLDEAERAVELYRQALGEGGGASGVSAIGHFAGFMPIPGTSDGSLIVASADGVGTKLVLARESGRLEGVGQDLVAMVVNDLLAVGARPLFLLDYLAVERLDAREAAEIVSGVARAAAESGAVLLGGETAELKGILIPGALDLAGFGVGIVPDGAAVTGEAIRVGDRLLALRSSGFHSNGYTLIRKILSDGVDPATPLQSGTLLEALLRPTALYPGPVLRSLSKAVHGLAPVTGGGIAGNLKRILPLTVDARLRLGALRPHEEMGLLMKRGHIDRDEALRSWNMGVGYVMVVVPDALSTLKGELEGDGVECWEIGRVEAGKGEVTWSS